MKYHEIRSKYLTWEISTLSQPRSLSIGCLGEGWLNPSPLCFLATDLQSCLGLLQFLLNQLAKNKLFILQIRIWQHSPSMCNRLVSHRQKKGTWNRKAGLSIHLSSTLAGTLVLNISVPSALVWVIEPNSLTLLFSIILERSGSEVRRKVLSWSSLLGQTRQGPGPVWDFYQNLCLLVLSNF